MHLKNTDGNDIQGHGGFNFRVPYLTIFIAMGVVVVYLLQSHPDTHIQIGQYFISAFSEYTKSQLFSEIVLLFISGATAEQFIKRWKVGLFIAIVSPLLVWFVEFIHPNMLDLGMSGGTMGLLGFGIMCIAYYMVEEPESEVTFVAMIGFGTIAVLMALGSFYGYLINIHVINIPKIAGLYKSQVQYIAHVIGICIGMVWWLYEHYTAGTV